MHSHPHGVGVCIGVVHRMGMKQQGGVERALGRRRRHQISGSVLKRGWGSSLLEGRGDSLDWF